MEDTEYVYTTNAQNGTVTVRSGTNPIPNSKIDLSRYQLTVYSSTPATSGPGGTLSYPPQSPLTVESAKAIPGKGVTDPNWTYPFNVTTDQSVQVSQVPDL